MQGSAPSRCSARLSPAAIALATLGCTEPIRHWIGRADEAQPSQAAKAAEGCCRERLKR